MSKRLGETTLTGDAGIADPRYLWNTNLLRGFDLKGDWFMPLIHGHVGYSRGQLSELEVEVLLVSRRCNLRSGTRMNARGLDDQGNAANTVETEQIMRIGPLLHSQVFTRGSVPVFWEQVAQGKGNLYEDVVLTRSFDMT